MPMPTNIRPKLVCLLALIVFASSWCGPCSAFDRPGAAEEEAVESANEEIGKVYKQLLSQLDSEGKTDLREEERAWIKWRDQEAERIAKDGGAVGGSAYRVDFLTAELKLIQQRTEELRKRLD